MDCSAVISGLVSKGLVEERGRLELPGRPLLYGTTTDFLRCLGISSLAELPQPQKEQHQEETDAEGSREEVLQQGEGTAE
ncbi:SMC-Scp complex subunit ScpB [Caproicibacter fermentans]|uniref:SMC-Scp complex subunit ScpB n=1 Tax=Caproicibacter fermentans TaxID=2576756 RepID=UPI00226B58C8|nr:SMC-Scp complex subunit ScpB [Caproicibacter fermentans]